MSQTGYYQYAPWELKLLKVEAEAPVHIDRSVRFFGPGPFKIGRHTRIDAFCILTSGEDAEFSIGRRCHIGPYVYLQGRHGLTLGYNACVSAHCVIYTGSDDFQATCLIGPQVPDEYRKLKCAPVRLDDGATLGGGCVVLPGMAVGTCSRVGATTLVRHRVPAWSLYFGEPPTHHVLPNGEQIQRLLEKLKAEDDRA